MYYIARVEFTTTIDTKGGGTREKKNKYQYLVDALSCTEAEARVVENLKDSVEDYEIKGVQQSKIIEVFEHNA
tara:strand:+ start:892 stop:1110 length:219 start_codon:yes stop_codon:yes gene_type:complete